jgi:hypothetical protein
MAKFSELNPSLRQAYGEYVTERWKQLYELQKDWGEKALNYLMLTNSGGAAATLGFIGASHGAAVPVGVRVSLFVFLLGVVFVGAAHAHTYHRMSNLFKTWRTDVGRYYSDELSWEELRDRDLSRTGVNVWDYLLPYAAFACFVGGGIVGALGFLSS